MIHYMMDNRGNLCYVLLVYCIFLIGFLVLFLLLLLYSLSLLFYMFLLVCMGRHCLMCNFHNCVCEILICFYFLC